MCAGDVAGLIVGGEGAANGAGATAGAGFGAAEPGWSSSRRRRADPARQKRSLTGPGDTPGGQAPDHAVADLCRTCSDVADHAGERQPSCSQETLAPCEGQRRPNTVVPEEELVRPDSPPVSPGDRPPDSPPAARPNNAVHAQIARLEGKLAGMREALVEAMARASAAETRAGAAEAWASEESAKTAQAPLAAFEQLAQRLEAMAAERAIKPWWQGLLRRAG
jgi:hypothetical protein